MRGEHLIDEALQAICLFDDDLGVFAQLIARQLTIDATRRFARRQERRFRQDSRVQWVPSGSSAATVLDSLAR